VLAKVFSAAAAGIVAEIGSPELETAFLRARLLRTFSPMS